MIYRSEHSAQNGFFLFSRKTAQDKALSFQALGLLAYILSKPPKWKAKDADIMKRGGIKKHAWGTILRELKDAGYAFRVRHREKDGTFTFGLEVSEEPRFTQESPLPDFPLVDDPLVDSQVVDIDSTRGRATAISINKREIREIERQSKPHRLERYMLPPDSMLELSPEDFVWLREKAPHVPDCARATEKWFLKQATARSASKTMAEWKISWQLYMMNYSDGESGRGNGHLGNAAKPILSEDAKARKQADLRERMTGQRAS